jgi:hypothetical protein
MDFTPLSILKQKRDSEPPSEPRFLFWKKKLILKLSESRIHNRRLFFVVHFHKTRSRGRT